MTVKRPWTEARLNVWYSEHDGKWAVTPEIPAGENFSLRIATFTSEADARLFAAAAAMYEVLKAYEQWEADLIMDNEAWAGGIAMFPTITGPLYDRMMELQAMRNAALRAANPSAFGEGET